MVNLYSYYYHYCYKFRKKRFWNNPLVICIKTDFLCFINLQLFGIKRTYLRFKTTADSHKCLLSSVAEMASEFPGAYEKENVQLERCFVSKFSMCDVWLGSGVSFWFMKQRLKYLQTFHRVTHRGNLLVIIIPFLSHTAGFIWMAEVQTL